MRAKTVNEELRDWPEDEDYSDSNPRNSGPGWKLLQPEDLIGITISDSDYENGNLLLFPEEKDQSGFYQISCAGGADLVVEGAIPHHVAEIIKIDYNKEYEHEFDIVFDDDRITISDPTGGEGIEVYFIYA